MIIKTPQHFKPLYTNDYMYCVYYGGRGGGKSEEVAKALVILAASKPLRILCIRETQSSISDSVKAGLEKWIMQLGLEDVYKITNDGLYSSCGSRFMFKGMQNYNAGNIKSISMIDITWIEEAEYFSKRSWDLLIPSVIRVKNPLIIATFNPAFEDDIIYKTFISGTPPPKSFVKKVSYKDNIYFKDTPLELQRAFEEKNTPEAEYRHKWLGELISADEESLWNNSVIDRMISDDEFNVSMYSNIVIGCDPATTNRDYSNEYGIVVMGITYDGMYHCVEDGSGNYNPNQFAMKVSQLYKKCNATEVIVEVNNGGDFIKSALLSIDSTLNVSEVRASSSKVTRFIPVANLAHMGKVKHIRGGFKKIERQMKLTSDKGFKGILGESPDRLDAYTWALYKLAGLTDKDTEQSVFKPEWFNKHHNFTSKTAVAENILYLSMLNNDIAYVMYNIYEIDYKYFIHIIDAGITLNVMVLITDSNSIMIPDNTLNQGLLETAASESPNVRTYDLPKDHLDDRILRIIPHLQSNFVTIADHIKPTSYNNELGNHLKLQLMRYTFETKLHYPMVELFCDIIENEKQL